MKKFRNFLVAILLIASFSTVSAQEKIGLSLHLGGALPMGQFTVSPSYFSPKDLKEAKDILKDKGSAVFGASIGLRYNYTFANTRIEDSGAGIFIAADLIWNYINKDVQNAYDSEKRTKPMYINVPIIIGGSWMSDFVNSPVNIWAEAGIGCDLFLNGILPAVGSESPLLYSEVNSIVLNPEWRVPYSIIKNEYYYKMVKNASGVIKKEKMYIIDNRSGKQVHPENIDWSKVSQKNIPYQLVQTSGRHNALGLYKFNFPNTESVYLHSTNNPGAFNHRKRDFSHGCIRVQSSAELATVLFEMNGYDSTRLEEVSIILGNKPTTEKGEKYLEKKQKSEEKYRNSLSAEAASFYRPLRPTNMSLSKKMPVFIEYHTAFIGPNGDVHYRNDVYHKDANILNAINKLAAQSVKDA